jgi:hypothetical protein
MNEPARLNRYAEDYLRLARDTSNPELKALLIRMAEVWNALAAHTDRIAAERTIAESMPDEPPSRDDVAPASLTNSPELSPQQSEMRPQQHFDSYESESAK